MISAGRMPAGKDPHRVELAARQAAVVTDQLRAEALENVAADGFPRVGGQTIDALVADGLIRRQGGRVPFALTLAGVDTIIANRKAARA